MKQLSMIPLAVALLLTGATLSQAQQPDNSAPARLSTPAAPQPSDANLGTDPGSIGNTGWTGGRADSHRKGTDQGANQPEVASGADLKGPPERFPANKTPE